MDEDAYLKLLHIASILITSLNEKNQNLEKTIQEMKKGNNEEKKEKNENNIENNNSNNENESDLKKSEIENVKVARLMKEIDSLKEKLKIEKKKTKKNIVEEDEDGEEEDDETIEIQNLSGKRLIKRIRKANGFNIQVILFYNNIFIYYYL